MVAGIEPASVPSFGAYLPAHHCAFTTRLLTDAEPALKVAHRNFRPYRNLSISMRVVTGYASQASFYSLTGLMACQSNINKVD